MVYTGRARRSRRSAPTTARILPYYERKVAAPHRLPFWLGSPAAGGPAGSWRSAAEPATDRARPLQRRPRRSGSTFPSRPSPPRPAPGRALRLSFIEADFRDTVFRWRFDLIVAPSDPLSHLTATLDRRRALRAVARQLAPDGRFVLDALIKRGRSPIASERRLTDRHGGLRIREDWRLAGKPGLWRATYTYSELRSGGSRAGTEASFLARAWNPAQIRPFFASCGLTVEELWGSFSRRPFGPGSSRLIVVARPSE